MTTLNLKEMTITAIQFFDYRTEIGIDENEDIIWGSDYSANIIFDEKFMVQLSGNEDEAHPPTIPSSSEQYYNDAELQDKGADELDIDDVIDALEFHEIENNFHYLQENGETL